MERVPWEWDQEQEEAEVFAEPVLSETQPVRAGSAEAGAWVGAFGVWAWVWGVIFSVLGPGDGDFSRLIAQPAKKKPLN